MQNNPRPATKPNPTPNRPEPLPLAAVVDFVALGELVFAAAGAGAGAGEGDSVNSSGIRTLSTSYMAKGNCSRKKLLTRVDTVSVDTFTWLFWPKK